MDHLGRILHPTDLSRASETAFQHALRLALAARARLRILHVAADIDTVHRQDFPGVRDTLARWGVIPADSPPERVADTGMDVRKIKVAGDDPVASIVAMLAARPVDLVVLATHHLHRRRPVAEPVARSARVPTLFVPEDASGFVDGTSGTAALRSVLLCADHDPDAGAAVRALRVILDALDVREASVTVFHAGEPDAAPELRHSPGDAQRWETHCRPGEPVDAIVECARERGADLIVMTTRGHDGFLDALRGSTTERVLRRAGCPLLAVPAA